uniref:TTF-type domain-containing protein n=1 Tax=Kalanchoe fedtschenkoi TaxID=63787 RepID=A0A7N0RCR7_KALFE
MYKYYKRKTPEPSASTNVANSLNIGEEQIDLENLPADPGLRRKISEYHPNIRDGVRRAYILKGPCQPSKHKFPQRDIGGAKRKFNENWFTEYKDWLEYSIEKDAVFCLCCYLFRLDIGKQGSGESFVGKGFTSWNKQDRLDMHVGGPASAHNLALQKCKDLMNREQHIDVVMHKRSDKAICEYRTRLLASIDCVRFLLCQGLSFRGHDESESSSNKGNFLELLKFLVDHNESIDNVVLQNAPGNLKLIAPNIQNDISNAAAQEVTTIIKDIDGDYFAILIDESRDVSVKEQMVVAVRYVNKKGEIIERLIGIVHRALDSLFTKYNLTISRVRGQGYDGASNMRGEFNGLKTLIVKENSSAFYVHCFAHQLQLTLVAIAKNHDEVASLFYLIGILTGVVGASCKRQDMLREEQAKIIRKAMEDGELVTGRGLNQETNLKKAADTRWQSHFGVLLNLMVLFPSVINVLDAICESGANSEHQIQTKDLLEKLQTFDFIFGVILMKNVLGVTNELSQALQKKDQDIVNAIDLVRISKEKLHIMRNNEWDSLLEERSRSRRKAHSITNLHHYRVEWYYSIIDMQILELNNRFDETNTELLRCMSCLSPSDRFAHFDKDKILRFAKFYPSDFSEAELKALDRQLDNYIIDIRCEDGEFLKLNGISELAQMLVMTKKDIVYKWVYLLVKLSLILPVATATVERAFSEMNIIKNRLRNNIGDQWMNDCLITFIEKDIFKSISNNVIYD